MHVVSTRIHGVHGHEPIAWLNSETESIAEGSERPDLDDCIHKRCASQIRKLQGFLRRVVPDWWSFRAVIFQSQGMRNVRSLSLALPVASLNVLVQEAVHALQVDAAFYCQQTHRFRLQSPRL